MKTEKPPEQDWDGALLCLHKCLEAGGLDGTSTKATCEILLIMTGVVFCIKKIINYCNLMCALKVYCLVLNLLNETNLMLRL